MSKAIFNSIRMFSSEGVALLNEDQELIQNSSLKFKKHPYPKERGDGWNGYRCFISECETYLLLEDSEVYVKKNGQCDYRPSGFLHIWVKTEDPKKVRILHDGIFYHEITSMPYKYVFDVEGAIAYIERWNQEQ